jgi:hypothetical protein
LYRPWRRLIDFLPRCAEPLVDDHEHALRLAVRLDAHELLDQLVKGDDPILGGAAVKQLGAARVPRRQVTQRAASLVLVLDALPALDARCRGERWMLAVAGLDRGFLITAHDVVAGVQQLAFPAAGVQVEDPAGLGGEVGIAREDPAAVLPGLDRILRQPPPDRHAGDLLADPAGNSLARELLR